MNRGLLQLAIGFLSFSFAGNSIVAASEQLPKEVRDAGFNDLVFSDEFTNIAVDSPRLGPWFSGLWYQPPFDARLLAASNDSVELSSLASITTLSRSGENGRTFKYGYFSARLRFDPDSDNWAAFWLFSAQHATDLANRHWCEIDVYENFKKDHFTGTLHDWKDEKRTGNNADLTHHGNDNYMQPIKGGLDVSVWNVYGLLWEPAKVTWFLNGRPIMSSPSPAICDEQEMFIILSAQSHSGKTSQKLRVDWVKVYGKAGETMKVIGFVR